MSSGSFNLSAPNFTPPSGMLPGPNAYDATRKHHAHGIPRLPFTIDGERSRPTQLALLRDRPLHTVASVNEDGEAESPLQIFTDETHAIEALRQGATRHASEESLSFEVALGATRVKLGLFLDLTIWEDIDFGGCAWEFDTNTDISILTNFDSAWSCGFLFWGWRTLGTNASSFLVSIGWPYFGFRDRAGSTIGWALFGSPPSWSGLVSNLVPFGWNDRAISITLPGATFP
jgi:hypothetical protein